ncbi:MAG TPA: hypothetical protein VNI81_01780 [Candidatus Limnocylindrales bacterium]|nr:hypothetical protein [Candidatus Limnocylindrales bacterium]
MNHELTTPWFVLLGLGAFHGINPGMGWLFAVALGLQERRRGAVLSALLPLGVGHALAVAAALVVALLVGAIVPLQYLRWIVAGVLIPLGVLCLFRHRHPRWASMRVGLGRLTLWSFLMASAHGAGLMVVPVFVGMSASTATVAHHHALNMVGAAPASAAIVPPLAEIPGPATMLCSAHTASPAVALLATGLHAAGYLIVTALIALLVYEKLGLAILRKAWLNLDLLWAAALIATGLISVFL